MAQGKTARKGALALLSALAWLGTAAVTAGEVVIGHPDIKLDKLTREQVSDLFLGKSKQLPDGTKVVVFDHKDREVIKGEFYRKVTNMTLDQLKIYWAKVEFTAQTFPPLSYAGDQAVKRLVSHTVGGIGYIEEGSVDDSVKVLFKP